MYRILLLLFILSAVECCGHSRHFRRLGRKYDHHRHRHGGSEDRRINDIAHKLLEMDSVFDNYCQENQNRTTETYGMDYVLKYNLPEYTKPNITVKVNYRVIYTTVEMEDKTFKDIRILPSILDLDKAGWAFDKGVLRVVIPYAVKLGDENQVKCVSADKTILEWRDINMKALGPASGIDVRSFPTTLPLPARY